MTHTREMADHEGDFRAGEHCPDVACHKCKKAGTVVETTWDSSCGGYTDYKFTCEPARGGCGHYWWVDGPDS